MESRFESTNLHELIEKMILLVSPKSNAKRIRVERVFDPVIKKVWIDGEKIKQVILNLLSNAVEFTPQQGMIMITTERFTETNNGTGVRIIVEDTGEGIPENLIDKIFDPYFTTKHKSGDHRGTGLGLFIVHQNIVDHGGTIEVKSMVKEGTRFIIDLPGHPQNGHNILEKQL
jgi:signal transduction histidine kinase